MDRLLAINEGMAVYYHDDATPTTRVDPFKYLNSLLSIRSAKGLVSFLQQCPNELVVMHEATAFKSEKDDGYVVGNYSFKRLKHVRPKRGMQYGQEKKNNGGSSNKDAQKNNLGGKTEEETTGRNVESEEEIRRDFFSRFDFGVNAYINAAAMHNVDYFDALTDLEQFTHYGDLLETWKDSFPKSSEPWSAEENKQFYEAALSRPKPALRVVFIDELVVLTRRLDAILELAALSQGVISGEGLFEFEHVNGPMGLCKTTIPESFISNLLPVKEAVYAIDNLHTDFYSHQPTRLHFEDDEGLFFVAHTSDEKLAVRDLAGCIVSFVLSEWSHFYNKTDAMSFDVNFGYQLYERDDNPVVTELCRIVSEGRVGICPVCERPFVVKRRPINGVINKTFCTNSCKVKGHHERRSNTE